MASWIVHVRVADEVLKMIKSLDRREFIVGNIAPDSGVPNEDWSKFTPDKSVSHYKTQGADGHHFFDLERYKSDYLSDEKATLYNIKELSFYLGYLSHLVTDVLWVENVIKPLNASHENEEGYDRRALINRAKKDYYDLDAKFVRDNPGFDSYNILKTVFEVDNYLDFMPEGAIADRIKYIIDFYAEERADLDRDYTYMNEKEMQSFVNKAACVAVEQIYRSGDAIVNKL